MSDETLRDIFAAVTGAIIGTLAVAFGAPAWASFSVAAIITAVLIGPLP